MRRKEQYQKNNIWIWLLTLICVLALIAASAWYFFRRDVKGVKSKVAIPSTIIEQKLA